MGNEARNRILGNGGGSRAGQHLQQSISALVEASVPVRGVANCRGHNIPAEGHRECWLESTRANNRASRRGAVAGRHNAVSAAAMACNKDTAGRRSCLAPWPRIAEVARLGAESGR